MSRNSRIVMAGLLALLGCMKVVQPEPSPQRPVVEVDASFDLTWDAVIDVFASENLPIQTLDRSSGLIAAEPLTVPRPEADRWAKCGGIKHGLDPVRELHATDVNFNVLVRDRDGAATVRVNARWTSNNPNDPMRPNAVCETTNAWESALESRIRRAAEGSRSG